MNIQFSSAIFLLLVSMCSGCQMMASTSKLMSAIVKGDKEQVVHLIEKGVDVNVRDSQGQTPLILAVKSCRDVIGDVVDRLAAQLSGSESPSNSDTEMISLGKNTGLEIAAGLAKTALSLDSEIEYFGGKPIVVSAGTPQDFGDTSIIQALITAGADVNLPDTTGFTALHWAVRNRNLVAAKALIGAGADPKIRDEDGLSPLRFALTKESAAIADLLLKGGADPNETQRSDGEKIIHYAIANKSNTIVKLLIKAGADVNALRKGWSPLIFALKSGCEDDVIDMLIEFGADVRSPVPVEILSSGQTEKGLSALTSGKLSEALMSPLMIAVNTNNAYAVARILRENVDVDDAESSRTDLSYRGPTALWFAIVFGYEEIAEMLIKAGASLNQPLGDGGSFMHYVALKNLKKMARFLIDFGVDCSAKKGDGETPLSIARRLGHAEIVELILSKYPELSRWESVKKPTAAIVVLGGMVAWIRAFYKGALELRDIVSEYRKSFNKWQRNRQKPRKLSPILPAAAPARGSYGEFAVIALSPELLAARKQAEDERKAREEAEQKRKQEIVASSKQVGVLINSINKARREADHHAVRTFVAQLLAELEATASGLASDVLSRVRGLIKSLNRDPRHEDLQKELTRIEQLK